MYRQEVHLHKINHDLSQARTSAGVNVNMMSLRCQPKWNEYRKPQNTQAIMKISCDAVTPTRGQMNTHQHTHAHQFSPTPPPPLLVDMQLEKRVFNEALGAHMLPFRRCFHNCEAQLRQPTLIKLCQARALVPPQHTESCPTLPLQTHSFPHSVTQSPSL